MKTIGMIGGMSFESTITYYREINEGIKEICGGFHSAKCILYSVDFEEIEVCQEKGEWKKAGDILTKAAQALEKGGADFIMICTNTMHKVVPQIQRAIHVPILHIAEATAQVVLQDGIDRIGLLGTRYTMEQDFYRAKFEEAGIQVMIPEANDREIINQVIFYELCLGNIRQESKAEFIRIVESLAKEGAGAVVLGCTEIGLLIKEEDCSIPVYDTTILHARAAVELALN